MTPVRILFPFAGDTVMGGSIVSAIGLAGGLDPARYQPLFLLHLQAGIVGEYLRDAGLDFEVLEDVPLMGASRFRRPGDVGTATYLSRTLPALRRKLRHLDPTIVHTNEGRMHMNWTLPAFLSGRRHLWHHRQDPDALGINKIAPILADHIVSVSHFAKPSRPVRPVERKFTIVRSPFSFPDHPPDRAVADAALRAELGLREDALLLGYFGVLNPRKRPVHFVEAIHAIQQRLPDRPVHGLLFGAPEREDEGLTEACQQKAMALGIGPQIHLMGFRSPIVPLMAGVDANLVTALGEPFGRTLIESMYLGTPVIATRHGGNAEAIEHGHNGFLVDPEDPAAFADPVVRLAQDAGLRTRIADAARAGISERYGREVHIAQMSAIYDRLARPRVRHE